MHFPSEDFKGLCCRRIIIKAGNSSLLGNLIFEVCLRACVLLTVVLPLALTGLGSMALWCCCPCPCPWMRDPSRDPKR